MFLSCKDKEPIMQTKVEELQLINQSLRENDKVKEEAIAILSNILGAEGGTRTLIHQMWVLLSTIKIFIRILKTCFKFNLL